MKIEYESFDLAQLHLFFFPDTIPIFLSHTFSVAFCITVFLLDLSSILYCLEKELIPKASFSIRVLMYALT